MVDDSPLSKYCSVMDEVKRRTLVIDFFASGAGHAMFQPTTVESIALQFRKILELIAMASLVANKRAYAAVYADFAKHWNAKFLLRDLKKVNSKFYPCPFRELPPTAPGTVKSWEDLTDGYLTEAGFVKLYEACGGMLHARNPYGSPLKYDAFSARVPIWRQKIVALLNCHKVQFINDDNLYVIHMKEDGHDNVRGYLFARVHSA